MVWRCLSSSGFRTMKSIAFWPSNWGTCWRTEFSKPVPRIDTMLESDLWGLTKGFWSCTNRQSVGQIFGPFNYHLACFSTVLGPPLIFLFLFLKLSLCVVLVISAKGRLQLGTNRGRIIRLLSNDLTQTFHATSVWYALPPVTTGFLHPQVDGRPTDWGNINIASFGTGS